MSGFALLLNLAGAVALLLWAARMVRTGVDRAFGTAIRANARSGMSAIPTALAAGAVMAVFMQSSTAVALLVTGLASSGLIASAAGLAAILGADLGSAIVVKVLTLDLSLLMPMLLVAGTVIFLSSERREWRQTGRILVGIGLLLLSIQLIGQAVQPLRQSPLTQIIVDHLEGDPFSSFLAAACFAWLVHSSVATILLIASLALGGVVGIEGGAAMALGANLGGAFIAVTLTRNSPAQARAPVMGNLAARGGLAAFGLVALALGEFPLDWLGGNEAQAVVHFHIAFNAFLAFFGVLAVKPLAAWTGKALEAVKGSKAEAIRPLALQGEDLLDPDAIENPRRALSSAMREVMRMGNTLEAMLRRIIELYEKANEAEIQQLLDTDDVIDDAHDRLKIYLAKVMAGEMNEEEAHRCQELIGASTRIEQAGDIIVRNMIHHVRKKEKNRVSFSPQGWKELRQLHSTVLANAKLSLEVLASRERETALLLVSQKEKLRDFERETSERHFERLAEGSEAAIDTSAIHLDTVRDLRQINSLLTWIAYSAAHESGA